MIPAPDDVKPLPLSVGIPENDFLPRVRKRRAQQLLRDLAVQEDREPERDGPDPGPEPSQ